MGSSNRKLRKIEIRDRLYRRRYLVPNAVTLANLFCGFLTIIYATSGRFEKAAIAIALAILLDGLDGRVARSLNATSRFGVEFDSFSDLVSFGVAPAILMYHWSFQLLADEFGVAVCFIYVLCAASRLARFNISAENLSTFEGLPTPGAAGFVAALVNFFPAPPQSLVLSGFGTFVMLSLGLLMVSQIEFLSIKQLKVCSCDAVRPQWAVSDAQEAAGGRGGGGGFGKSRGRRSAGRVGAPALAFRQEPDQGPYQGP
jgi:CDP-diacylglycerol--serine O-phosphatidyltransferase